MRLGVLDVGSNTVHLLVVDAHAGAPPTPAHSVKSELRLAELHRGRRPDRRPAARRGSPTFLTEALEDAEDKGVEELLGFATSAIRDAPNGEEVLARVREITGISLEVLAGEDEARLTFLAVRRWYGWSAGRLHGARHRWGLARGGVGSRRGAGRRLLGAARGGPAHPGVPHPGPAGRRTR